MSKKLLYYGSTASFQNLYSNNLDAIDEYVTMGDNNAFTIPTGFSVTGWFKSSVVDANLRILASKYNGATNVAEFWILFFNGGLRFHLFGSGSAFNRIGRNSNSSIISANVWYYFAVTWTGGSSPGSAKIYLGTTSSAAAQVDTADSSAGSFTGLSNTSVPLCLGVIANVGAPFSGKQYQFALWEKALSLAESQEIQTKKGGDLRTVSCAANLVDAWHFPTGTGDYPTETGYKSGYNGTMTNQESTDINTDVP